MDVVKKEEPNDDNYPTTSKAPTAADILDERKRRVRSGIRFGLGKVAGLLADSREPDARILDAMNNFIMSSILPEHVPFRKESILSLCDRVSETARPNRPSSAFEVFGANLAVTAHHAEGIIRRASVLMSERDRLVAAQQQQLQMQQQQLLQQQQLIQQQQQLLLQQQQFMAEQQHMASTTQAAVEEPAEKRARALPFGSILVPDEMPLSKALKLAKAETKRNTRIAAIALENTAHVERIPYNPEEDMDATDAVKLEADDECSAPVKEEEDVVPKEEPSPSTSVAGQRRMCEVHEKRTWKAAYRCRICFAKYWVPAMLYKHTCLTLCCSLCSMPYAHLSTTEKEEHFETFHSEIVEKYRQSSDIEDRSDGERTGEWIVHRCKKCNAKFRAKSKLNEHRKTCLSMQCMLCEQPFLWSKSRDIHMLHTHSFLPDTLTNCTNCDRDNFETGEEFIEHLYTCVSIVSNTAENKCLPQWMCTKCRRTFDEKEHAYRHAYWMHLSPIVRNCQQCMDKMDSEFELKYHITKIHTEKKKYKCKKKKKLKRSDIELSEMIRKELAGQTGP